MNMLHFAPRAGRPNPLDRDAAAARNAQAFDNGDRRRRHDTAHQLEQLAREIKQGKHGELVLMMASRLLALRSGR